MRKLALSAVAVGLIACQPSDPPKPQRPAEPQAQAYLVSEADAHTFGGGAAATPTMAAGTEEADAGATTNAADDAGATTEQADGGAQADVAALDPDREVLPGDVHARFMLEEPVWDDAQRFEQFCDDAILRAQRVRASLKEDHEVAPPPAAVLGGFAQLSLELDTVDGLMGLMFAVNPHRAVRDVAEACEQKLAKLTSEIGLDRDLYEALQGVDAEALDDLGKRFRDKRLREFRRAGVDKDEATRKRISDIDAEMVKLGQSFRKNVNEDVREIVVDSADALADMPADWRDAHEPGEDGKIRVTTDYPDFFPFQTYVSDWQLRAALYREFNRRAFPANADILKKILALRHEYANLLGYADYAAYAVEDGMASKPEVVDAFIKSVQKIVRPRADKDVAELLERKRRDLPDAKTIEVYDRFYYVTKVQEEKLDFDAKTVREYFSYPAVKDGILSLYGELFDLEFTKLDVPTWDPSVDAYEMKSGGKLVGRFFLDMHPRADKYKHAAAFPIQTGLSNERIPWASLVCNFPNPADGDGHALMEHEQVVTFFHEFGHLIHHLLARAGTYVDLAGFNVEWDFVEAPSQILEEWAWEPSVLARFAKHYETGDPIPPALVAKMKAADEFGKGLSLQRQVFYTAYSFYLHRQAPKRLDLDRFTDGIYDDYSPFPRLEGGKIYANFGHLIGYSALYYTYQWSLAIAKDLFTEFEANGLLNKDVAQRYRRAVLEPGGTRDAADLIRDFLGRERNLEAYEAWIQSEAAPTP